MFHFFIMLFTVWIIVAPIVGMLVGRMFRNSDATHTSDEMAWSNKVYFQKAYFQHA